MVNKNKHNFETMYERYGEFWTINVRKMSKKKYVFYKSHKRRVYNQ